MTSCSASSSCPWRWLAPSSEFRTCTRSLRNASPSASRARERRPRTNGTRGAPSPDPTWRTRARAARCINDAATGPEQATTDAHPAVGVGARPGPRGGGRRGAGLASRHVPHHTSRLAGPPMSLERYQQKRDFTKTPEPAGAPQPSDGPPRFVIQRHRARRLHYDFRLEVDGVLASWAVPKGADARPVGRATSRCTSRTTRSTTSDFEGVIPGGEYGSGDVIVWDRGTWELHKDPDAATAIANGERPRRAVRREAHGQVRADPHEGRPRRQGAVAAAPQARRARGRRAGTPRTIPARSSAAAPTTRSRRTPSGSGPGRRARSAATPEQPERAAADRRRARRPRRARRKGTWAIQGHDLALTNLDKVLFPAGDDERARHQARPGALLRAGSRRCCCRTSPTGRSTCNRFPNGADTQGLLAEAGARRTRPTG